MPISFTCPHCGKTTNVADELIGRMGPCAGCGKTITVVAPGANPFADMPVASQMPATDLTGMGDDPAVRMLLPVGRSPWAIVAGYFGLFAVLFFPAPIALVLGVIAVRHLRRHPEQHGMGRAIFAIVMGTLFTIPLIILLVGSLVGA